MKRFLVLILIIVSVYYTFGRKDTRCNMYRITTDEVYYEETNETVFKPILDKDDRVYMVTYSAIVGFAILMAMVAAILFGWQFNHFAVAIIATAVFVGTWFVGIMLCTDNYAKAIEHVINADETLENIKLVKGGKIPVRYFQKLNRAKVVEIANKADYYFIIKDDIENNEVFNNAVRNVDARHNVSGKNFDIAKTSLRDHYNEINEKLDVLAKTKEVRKEYRMLMKQHNKDVKLQKKLEAKQLKEAAKNGGKKVWGVFEWLFGDN